MADNPQGTSVSTLPEHTDVTEGPNDAGSLLALGLRQGADVSVLERLLALKERVDESNRRAAFFEALARFHEQCPPIERTRENSQFQVTRNGVKKPAKYAALEDIDRVARPVASACGLAWTWNTVVEGEAMNVTCRLLHVLGHREESTVTMPLESRAGSSAQQKYGSAQTYGMRYSLIAALGLTTADEDLDGAAASGGGEAGAKITEGQAADLQVLLLEVGADKAKFLRWLKVESLADIPVEKYREAVAALEQKRRAT